MQAGPEAERDRGPEDRLLADLVSLSPADLMLWVEDTRQSDEEVDRVLWWLEHGWQFRERPVDLRTFLFSSAYMGSDPRYWYPEVLRAVEEIEAGEHTECLFTGSIGSAKTSAALLVELRQLYRLLCMHSPHQVYGLVPTDEIAFVFQSVGRDSADVAYQRFRALVDSAPLFRDPYFRYDEELRSEMRFPNRLCCIPVAGTRTGALSRTVYGGLIDELGEMARVKRSLRARGAEDYDQALVLYESIARRRESRFMSHGSMPGKLCLAGSRVYPDDFLQRKLDEAREHPERVYVYDKRTWDVKPWEYGEARFRVFVGDASRAPRVLADDEEVAGVDAWLVERVPAEFRDLFERDPYGSIRDIAGRPTEAVHPYIVDVEAVMAAFPPDWPSVISTDRSDMMAGAVEMLPGRWSATKQYPRHAHLDMALTQDSAGLAIGHVAGFREIRRSKTTVEVLPVVTLDLILEVVPPRGGEISFERIRELLYALRDHGLPIRWFSCDSWQTRDTLQQLASRGFRVGLESNDKDQRINDVGKAAIYDGRVRGPRVAQLLQEIRGLERDPKTGKIDHKPGGGKDLWDAVVCTIYSLSLQRGVWRQHGIPLSMMPESLAEAATRSKNDVEGKMQQ